MHELIQDIQESFVNEKLQNKEYANDVYLAMCNIIWKKEDITNTFSFREAAGLIANLRNQGEMYLDFYPAMASGTGKVEGTVTNEVREDLRKIGWEGTDYTFSNLTI